MLKHTQSFARSGDGTEIAVYDFGGNGPDLLLGHATGFCAMVWEPVVALLRERFRCVAYDLRGHGSSARPTEGRPSWDWNRYAEDALAAIDALSLQRPFSVGHSCGAATALLLEQARPNTLRAIVGFEPVMFDAIPPTGPDEDRDLAKRALARRTDFPSRSAALANFSERGPFTRLHPAALEAYIEYGFEETSEGSVRLRCDPEDEAAVYVMASAHTGFERLAEVSCPVTVVHGSSSVAFEESVMRKVAARVSNGTFVSMHDVGHFGALERPEEFAALVLDAFRLDVA